MKSQGRSRSRARVAAGSSLAAAAAIAALSHDSSARRKMVFDEDFSPSVTSGFDGPAIGGRSAPTTEAAAHLAGGPIAMIGDRSLVIDADSGELVLADAKGVVLDRMKIGAGSNQLVYDAAARRAYVADRSGDRIVKVDVGDTLKPAGDLATPTEPFGLALGPDRKLLLVTTVADRTLTAYDTATGDELWNHALSREPRGVAISPDGHRAAVAYLATGTVELIDLADQRGHHVALETPRTNAFGGFSGLQQQSRRIASGNSAGAAGLSLNSGRAFARNAFAVRFIGHGLTVVAHQVSTPVAATSFRENTGSYGGGFSPPITHRLAFLAGTEAQVGANITVHQPEAIAWDARTDTLYVAGYGSDDVQIVDHASQADARLAGQFRVTPAANTACGPQGLAVADDGSVTVWCSLSRSLAKMTRKAGTPTAEPIGKELTSTRLTKVQHRGLELFRLANDGRLSSRGALACASCHPEVRADGLSWRIEGRELQTPLLSGKVLDTHPYKWDGGDKDITTSLSATMRRLGGGGLPADETKALSAYLESVPAPRTPHRAAEKIARGKEMFEGELGCISCHNGALRTDREKHSLTSSMAEVDTPALVGLAYSAPYFHDGSAATLEALLADNGLVHGMAETSSLTDEQVADLVAYLETL